MIPRPTAPRPPRSDWEASYQWPVAAWERTDRAWRARIPAPWSEIAGCAALVAVALVFVAIAVGPQVVALLRGVLR